MPADTELFDREVRQLIRSYNTAAREIAAQITSIRATEFQRVRGRELLDQVNATIRDLQNAQLAWARGIMPRAYRTGMRFSAQALGRDLPTMSAPHRRAIAAITEEIVAEVNGKALESVAPMVGSVFRRARQTVVEHSRLLEELGVSEVRGLTVREMTQRLVQTLRDGATERLKGSLDPALAKDLRDVAEGKFITIIDKNGVPRRFNLNWYGETVARSTSRMAASEGTVQTVKEFGGDLVQVSVHSQSCPRCLPYQGKVYSVSGKHKDFPALKEEARPPIHPRCEHVLLPVVEDFLRRRGTYDTLAQFSRDAEARVGNTQEYQDLLQRAGAAPPARKPSVRPRRQVARQPAFPQVANERGRRVMEQWRDSVKAEESFLTQIRSGRVRANAAAYYHPQGGEIVMKPEIWRRLRRFADTRQIKTALSEGGLNVMAEEFMQREFGVAVASATSGQLRAAYLALGSDASEIIHAIKVLSHEVAHSIYARGNQWTYYRNGAWTGAYQEAATEWWARVRWRDMAEEVFGVPKSVKWTYLPPLTNYDLAVETLQSLFNVMGVSTRGAEVEGLLAEFKFRVTIQDRPRWLSEQIVRRLGLEAKWAKDIEVALEGARTFGRADMDRMLGKIGEIIDRAVVPSP